MARLLHVAIRRTILRLASIIQIARPLIQRARSLLIILAQGRSMRVRWAHAAHASNGVLPCTREFSAFVVHDAESVVSARGHDSAVSDAGEVGRGFTAAWVGKGDAEEAAGEVGGEGGALRVEGCAVVVDVGVAVFALMLVLETCEGRQYKEQRGWSHLRKSHCDELRGGESYPEHDQTHAQLLQHHSTRHSHLLAGSSSEYHSSIQHPTSNHRTTWP